ncbi:DNA repair protein RecN [Parasulfuritortus cantonensis]|uniref:DNA repair protein RecN n=1 Tax=Parasulfuritortus cantonensis TaxID=2528202 RepID=A0A4R1BDC4_9PROT|nr:DNA repair protein RecN [Parasulfuritortus cantonensis]TCJ15034.1 DNA repair protein RecN [Parasulfuritortus cantonensis]
MLLGLSIRDFVLVDRLDLEFGAGFSVLTGETGAGKSILLDALQLALGERAESGVVRTGGDRAEVTASFAVTPELAAWLRENGLEGDDDTCLLRRVIEAGGRSRAFVNGRPVTLAQLKEAGEFLVDIHGQHAHYSLLRAGEQRRILDQYAGAGDLAARVAEAWRDWQARDKARREAEAHAAEAAEERERLQWRVDELAALAFSPEEWGRLQDDHRRLAHAAELLQGVQQLSGLLDDEAQGVLGRLHAAHGRLAGLAEIDADLAGAVEMLDGALIQAGEAVRELNHYAERVDLDPEALEQAEARLAAISDAARKFRVRPEELPALLETSSARLAELERLADPAGLARAAETARTAYMKLADSLSGRRREAAARLAEAVSQAMQRLSMQGGRLEVALAACQPEATGLESVEFLVAPHAGQGAKPLAKTASGGELSRIGLALQTILSETAGAPVLVFDEVDAGIGGGVAEIVGRLLADLGRRHQVLCVTHLPQVAAGANGHFRVSKATVAGHALSRVAALERSERVEELARMLGGVTITETTRRHAEEMLAGGAG